MSDELMSFLAAVRRRLWLEALGRRCVPALRAASAVWLLAGLVNLTFGAVPWTRAAMAAFAAAALVLLPVLWQRPALARCAALADRRFGGHSLLTTALEVRNQPPDDRAAAAVAVLRRAEEQTRAWRPRLGHLPRHPPAAGSILTLVPAFVGLVLLQAEPPGTPAGPASAQSGAIGETGVAVPGGFDAAPDPAALRDSLREPRSVSSAAVPSAAARQAQRPGGALPPPDARIAMRGRTAAVLPGRAGTAAAGAGPEPGDAHRSPEASASAARSPSPAGKPRLEVPVARAGEASAADDASGRDFTEGHRESDGFRRLQPAAAPPGPDGWTTLTAAEVAYAKRYLDTARHARD